MENRKGFEFAYRRFQELIKKELQSQLEKYKAEIKPNKILYDDDLIRIEYSCISYPMGSSEIGRIAELSGRLYGLGVDVEGVLERLLESKRGKAIEHIDFKVVFDEEGEGRKIE